MWKTIIFVALLGILAQRIFLLIPVWDQTRMLLINQHKFLGGHLRYSSQGIFIVCPRNNIIFGGVMLEGVFEVTYNHRPGPCRIVPGITNGSEDMHTLSDGLAIITGDLNVQAFMNPSTEAELNGNVYLFDFNAPDKDAEKLKIVGDSFDRKKFNPNGIGLYEDTKSGMVFVFVVNHSPDGDQIEKFTFDRKSRTLTHLQSIKHETFTVLNDVVPIDDTHFYTTRFQYFKNQFLNTIATLALLRWGSVLYVDTNENTVKTAVSGIMLPNGIHASPDKKYIYVVNTADRNILVYQRGSDNSLTELRTVDVYALTDNLDVDQTTGDLWLGVQAIGYKTGLHFTDINYPAPSRVLYVKMSEDAEPQDVRDVFVDDKLIYASTIATRYKDAMLVGSAQHNMVYCQLVVF